VYCSGYAPQCASGYSCIRKKDDINALDMLVWHRVDDYDGAIESGDQAEGKMRMRFRNKIALISGAGSGIGRATAQIIGEEGGTIVGVDLDYDGAERIMAGIRRSGGKARALQANALDPAQVQQAVQQAVAEHGRIDILVNGVGGSTIIANSGATVDELTFEDWQRLISFNLNH
jgi:NADP-dependent 3-hydroxy acid dehydrogenase YdfG